MHPILIEIPALPAWVAAAALVLVGAVFAFMAMRDSQDRGSWWIAAMCGVGAAAVFVKFGVSTPVGPLPVRFFGLLVVSGFLAATWVASRRNARLGLMDGEETFDLTFWILLWGLAGGRMLWVFQNMDDYAGQPQKILAVWDGGLVWYGGAVASATYAFISLAKRGKPVWPVADSLALGLPLGQALGRVGCFLAGCDYGTVVEGGRESVPWAVNFPYQTEDIPTLVPRALSHVDGLKDGALVYLHPAQLYLFLSNLIIFGLLFLLDRRAGGKGFPGRVVALYLILYSLGRGIVEHWRGDADRGVYDLGFLTLSFSQIISVFVLLGGIVLYRKMAARGRAAPA